MKGHRAPPDKSKSRQKAAKKSAAGIPAIISTTKHSLKKMGLIKSLKTLSLVNQKEGFDCPGCAWPDPEDRTSFEFCENGAKAVADEAMNKKIGAKFFKKYSISELSEKSDYWLNSQGRLILPMYKAEGSDKYNEISWDDAFNLIGKELKSLKSPNEAIFYTSGRTSNEAAFLYQLFVRAYGTNNLPDCSNMCHESSGRGLSETIGIGKGTVTLDDFNKTSLVIVMGQNPGTNHPRMLSALESTKKNGGNIIHVNPLPEAGLVRFKHPQDYMKLSFKSTKLSDLHLPVKINGDVALMKGIGKYLLEKKNKGMHQFDDEFINNKTNNFKQYIESLEKEDWDIIVSRSGLSRSQIESAGEMISQSKSIIICWAMGLTQHVNGVDNVKETVNLLLLGGHFGRAGAGVCPVRGHSNVQGDRTMGIWEKPKESFLKKLEERFKFKAPYQHGHDTVSAIKAMYDGEIKVFLGLGGNFISATPDTDYTAKAMKNTELSIQISTKLNRSHLITGKKSLILPCLGRTEKDIINDIEQVVSVENSMGIVHRSKGNLKPASSSLKSEPDIIANIAKRSISQKNDINWDYLRINYDNIRDAIEDCIDGFENYNERLRMPSGFNLPNPPKDTQSFSTDDGKANFTVTNIPENSNPEGYLTMMTIRSHDQYNTTIYGLDDRYRGIKGNRYVVLMNEKDIDDLGFKPNQKVKIISDLDGVNRVVDGFKILKYEIPRGCIATYFPEANPLVPIGHVALKSNTPASKSIPVRLELIN